MDPSKENKNNLVPLANKKNKIFLVAIIVLFIIGISSAGFYFFSDSKTTPTESTESENTDIPPPSTLPEIVIEEMSQEKIAIDSGTNDQPDPFLENDPTDSYTDSETTTETPEISSQIPPIPRNELEIPTTPPASIQKKAPVPPTICNKPEKQLDAFYAHLDTQKYIKDYKLPVSSKVHFTELMNTLLSNPPQITRESDDLYTILKNTAHFFRISGKDNILMMKGILDSENKTLEQILADYYLLVTDPECKHTPYGNIDKEALYEYACFFLNTMGGRLYLFRRDSLSRMVVTYYAILLVDQANIQNNNRYGISLRPVINMLISEMESGGSALNNDELYLDTLYELKEKYQ